MRFFRPLLSPALLALALGAGPAFSDRALFLGAEPDPGLVDALEVSGFDIEAATEADATGMRSALAGLLEGADAEEPRLIFLAGRFVSDGRSAWLLAPDPEDGTGATDKGAPNRATVANDALGLDTVLAVAAEAPGAAIVAVASVAEGAPEPGPGLYAGFAPPTSVPQGVTLIYGPRAQLEALLAGAAGEPGASLSQAVDAADDVFAIGFLPRGLALVPPPEDAAPADDAGEASPSADDAIAWARAVRAADVAGYRRYLERFPEGAHAEAAREAIAEIENEPDREARLAEEALQLDREARRRIQSQLTLLDYEPRGVDGIFGPGSRAAIRRFQREQGYPPTGYLTRAQIEALSRAATQRQAELEAEAERRRLAAEAEDRAVWEATGAAGDEAGLRTYLRRYPDGLFAEEARAGLDTIESEKRGAAESADAEAGQEARATDTEAADRAWFERRDEGAPQREAAQAEERQLGLNDITRLLIEERLAQLGLEPGATDGNFDDDTRRAIRNFQRARDLAPTGYLSQDTVARMLSDLTGLLGR